MKSNRILNILFTVWLSFDVHAFLTTEENGKNCEETQYFNSATLTCQDCPSTEANKLIPTSDCKKIFHT